MCKVLSVYELYIAYFLQFRSNIFGTIAVGNLLASFCAFIFSSACLSFFLSSFLLISSPQHYISILPSLCNNGSVPFTPPLLTQRQAMWWLGVCNCGASFRVGHDERATCSVVSQWPLSVGSSVWCTKQIYSMFSTGLNKVPWNLFFLSTFV
jgi:hypothetical protein